MCTAKWRAMSDPANIFIGAFTTCWARLKLYSYFEQVDEQVLYYDTDSVIYHWKSGQPYFPTGNFLGEMTDELDGDVITKFVSGGAKHYGYVTRVIDDEHPSKTVCKVRGFTLDVRDMEVLNYASMKKNIVAELENPEEKRRVINISNPTHFQRDVTNKRIKLVNRVKTYGLVFDKRVVDPVTKSSLPYRFTRMSEEDEENVEVLLALNET